MSIEGDEAHAALRERITSLEAQVTALTAQSEEERVSWRVEYDRATAAYHRIDTLEAQLAAAQAAVEAAQWYRVAGDDSHVAYAALEDALDALAKETP